jgi:N-acetylneuraminic acid mutarotase
LGIIDGYIYLFGGIETNHATASILRAAADDPLTWVDVSANLPEPLYNSQLGIIDGYVYLFGGQTFLNTATDTIYRASLSSPLVWSNYSSLPYETCGAQFFTVGNKGYLIGPTPDSGESFAKILRCRLSNPGQWIDTLKTVPGVLSQSKLAIIYDRLFLFGGSGSSVIFANNYRAAYKFDLPNAIAYTDITRIQYNETFNKLDLFRILGFPPWKTDYGS